MTDISARLRSTTEEMANFSSQNFDLWCRHSNAALEAADTIEVLRAENARLTAARNECERQFQAKVDEIIVLLNERDVLREALKPFVRECNRLVAGYHRPENQMRPAITAGELRAARAAYLGEKHDNE